MANWFCSSASWTAVTAWASLTSYSVGDIRRQLATPTVGEERVWRCTTAGLSGATEPAPWTLTKGSTTNDGTVVWTEITGSSTYNTSGSWLAPHARMRIAVTWMAAGDNLYVRDNHNATEAAAIIITFPGTQAAPNNCIIVDNNFALSLGAKETTTGSANITFGGSVYVDASGNGGLVVSAGTGNNVGSINLSNTSEKDQIFKFTDFILATTNGSSKINCGAAGQGQFVQLNGCRFKMGNTSQNIFAYARLIINGGSWLSGGTTPTKIFASVGTNVNGIVRVSGFDFSNLTATASLINGGQWLAAVNIDLINCKLPSTAGSASWSGTLFTTAITGHNGVMARMHNCDDGNTNYKMWEESYYGSIKQETTIVRTSPAGATDGVTSISWKIATNSTNIYPLSYLRSPVIAKRQNTVGSSITVTIDIIHDSVTNLTDADIWIEVEYLGDNSFPLSTFINDSSSSVLATPADQTASTSTWTTTGLTNPNKQKLSVTFTPQQKGYILAKVCVALASKTVYINPLIDIS